MSLENTPHSSTTIEKPRYGILLILSVVIWFMSGLFIPHHLPSIEIHIKHLFFVISWHDLIQLIITTSTIGVIFSSQRRAFLKQRQYTYHGSAQWSDEQQVKATGLLSSKKGGVYLGVFQKKRDHYYLRHQGSEHILVFAPTRSGKGVGIVIPTLLGWHDSILVHDIKGENYYHTSGYRQRILKQRILKFDPTSHDSHRFNPLNEIRLGSEFETRDVQNIATMIVDPDGRGLNDHWAKTGFDLLVGVILHVLYAETDKSLNRVQSLLSTPGKSIEQIMKDIQHTNHLDHSPHPLVAQSAQSFLNKAANEASGVLSTALSFLSLYKDEVVAENVRTSD